MIGFVSKSAICAIVLLTATFANAGNLHPAPQGAATNTMHPAPQGSPDTAVAHANDNGLTSVMKEEDKVKLRKLRPAK